MRYNILIGGEAGQGPNILSNLVSKGLISQGYYVFYSRDYQSLIRGGHNFNLVSVSNKPIASNHQGIDILVALDKNTEKIHKKELKKDAIIFRDGESNMFYAGCLFKIFGFDFKILDSLLKELKKRYKENIKQAKQGYEQQKQTIKLPKVQKKNLGFMNGNQAITQGALASGLDIYYAYPMTPATPVMTELAQAQLDPKNQHLAIQLENEIAVINAAVGSSIVGAKTMVGTSGGGFDLMSEGISLIGMAEVPLVIYLAQRPGPSTGVPTYTSQGDLKAALGAGHGEFPRVVIAPGDTKEAAEATSEAFYFSQKYRIPAILLGDKHLAESKFSYEGQPKLTKSQKAIIKLERFHSYESDKEKVATEAPELIKKGVEKRIAKQQAINKEAEKFQTHKIHGNKASKNLIIGWGSTKGAILDAVTENNLNCKFLQVIYIEPFSKKIKQEIQQARNIIVIENNSTSPLSSLIAEKTGYFIENKNKILKYDGRPFTSTEIEKEIKKRLK